MAGGRNLGNLTSVRRCGARELRVSQTVGQPKIYEDFWEIVIACIDMQHYCQAMGQQVQQAKNLLHM